MTTKPEPHEPGRLLHDPATDEVRAGHRAGTAPSLRPSLDDISRPPRPVPGCAACAELVERRQAARDAYDRSAETDANVLLRQHQRQEHRP
jgi:hypothetical protein